MKRIKVSNNFYLDEFIAPSIYVEMGAERAMRLLDQRLVAFAQWLRDTTGRAVTINNWATGGQYKESGIREFKTKTGAKYSMHKYSRALDLKVSGMTPREVHAFLLSHETMLVKNQWVTRMEDVNYTPTWTHVDNAFTNSNKIVIVKP